MVITGHTRIGRNNRVFQFASLGEIPQDKKYRGEPTRLEIGDNNTIRECCTFNVGTAQDSGVTRLGDDNWIMAYAHIAHDCQVGSHTVLANSVQLAGHVTIGDHAILGGGDAGAPVLPGRCARLHRGRLGRAARRAALRDGRGATPRSRTASTARG